MFCPTSSYNPPLPPLSGGREGWEGWGLRF